MRISTLATIGCMFLAGAVAAFPADAKRASPHEKVSATVGGKQITIEYGRPYMKGRKIMGGLVPYDKVWRTGADEATTLTTEADLDIGGLRVPKGSYGLFTVPGESGWKLVVNKTAKQWGAFKYQESDDLGRVDMQVSKPDQPVEQFTISLDAAGGDKATLRMAWENTVATVPITVQ